MHKFLDGLASLRSPLKMLDGASFTSVIIWLFETSKYWFVMHAFNFQRQLLCADADERHRQPGHDHPIRARLYRHLRRARYRGAGALMACDQAIAAGYTLVLHAALWIPITLLGAYYLTREGINGSMRCAPKRIVRESNCLWTLDL